MGFIDTDGRVPYADESWWEWRVCLLSWLQRSYLFAVIHLYWLDFHPPFLAFIFETLSNSCPINLNKTDTNLPTIGLF